MDYHNQDWCNISNKNLCKGHVLTEYINKRKSDDGIAFSKVSYVGDGNNDICPSLKLSQNDRVFARKDFPLHKALNNNSELKAKLYPFVDGLDIWKTIGSNKLNNNEDWDLN